MNPYIIYMIYDCDDPSKFYIGCTERSLTARISRHRTRYETKDYGRLSLLYNHIDTKEGETRADKWSKMKVKPILECHLPLTDMKECEATYIERLNPPLNRHRKYNKPATATIIPASAGVLSFMVSVPLSALV